MAGASAGAAVDPVTVPLPDEVSGRRARGRARQRRPRPADPPASLLTGPRLLSWPDGGRWAGPPAQGPDACQGHVVRAKSCVLTNLSVLLETGWALEWPGDALVAGLRDQRVSMVLRVSAAFGIKAIVINCACGGRC